MDPASAELGSPVNIWGPAYMERRFDPTRAEALDLAGRTDIIIAKAGSYTPHVADMRAVNPRLRLVAYLNGTMADDRDGAAYPASWYVRTPTGEQVRSTRYGNYLMDPRVPGWIAERTSRCQALVAASGYDGCALDVLGTAPVTAFGTPDAYVTGEPIDSQTGKMWTKADWLAATTALADTMRASIAPSLVWGNGIGNGLRYADPVAPSAVLFQGTDGMVAEGFLRSGRAPIETVPSYELWKLDLDMVLDAEARGRHLAIDTKVWTTATAEQKDRWHAFSLGTYLLGTKGRGGTVRYAFLRDQEISTTVDHPWWHLPLGQPTAPPAQRASGVWERRFEGGRVLVNPFPTTATVRFKTSYRTLSGAVTNRIVLPAHGAELLRAV